MGSYIKLTWTIEGSSNHKVTTGYIEWNGSWLGVYMVLELNNEDYMKCMYRYRASLGKKNLFYTNSKYLCRKCMMALILADIVLVDVQYLSMASQTL